MFFVKSPNDAKMKIPSGFYEDFQNPAKISALFYFVLLYQIKKKTENQLHGKIPLPKYLLTFDKIKIKLKELHYSYLSVVERTL